MLDVTEVLSTLDLLDRSGDRVVVAFELDGRTRKLDGTMSPAEARFAIGTAVDLGATRVSVDRVNR